MRRWRYRQDGTGLQPPPGPARDLLWLMPPNPCAKCGTCTGVCARLRAWQKLPPIGYDDDEGHKRFDELARRSMMPTERAR